MRPRIRRRLRVVALGLVLLPTLALALLVRAVAEADREARSREVRERRARVQGRAEDLAARLAAQPALFPPLEHEPRTLARAAPPRALVRPVDVDGDCGDWRIAGALETPCTAGATTFDRRELVAGDATGWSPADLSFDVATGARQGEGHYYVFLRVADDDFRVRKGGLRLRAGDRLHWSARAPWGPEGSVGARFVSTFEPGGQLTTYQVDSTWTREVPPEERLAWGDYRAPAYRRPYGVWRATERGYDVEVRLPLRALGARPGDARPVELGLAVVDVDAPSAGSERRGLVRKALWVVPQRPGSLALAAPAAATFRRDWAALGLDLRGRRVAVLDARGRELFTSFREARRGDGADAELRASASALLSALRRRDAPSVVHPSAPLAAARVVSQRGELLGIVVERDTGEVAPARVLAVLRGSPTLAAMLGGALLLLFVGLWDTRRLSRRILSLVDDVGADRYADDEIGELSRRLSDLVERVRADRSYLERLPAILGHETLGPLGVVKMYLDDVATTERRGRYPAARRALRAIEELIEDLREATSLEEALARGERCDVDLAALLADAVVAYADANRARIELDLADGAFPATVIEGRVEQLLDKLLDNAVEFSQGAPVRVTLDRAGDALRLRVENRGPPLPEGPAAESLFEPLWSARKRTSERHLGLGLYVARVIAEHHGGAIRGRNAEDGRVVFEVTLRSADAAS